MYIKGEICQYAAPSIIIEKDGEIIGIIQQRELAEDVIKEFVGELLG